MKRKIIISVFLIIMSIMSMMMLGLAGCKKDSGIVELRFMGYNQESSRAAYLKYLEDTLPDVKIVFEFVSLDEFNDVLISQLENGAGPDIIAFYHPGRAGGGYDDIGVLTFSG